MSWVITDLTGNAADVVRPTEADALLALEDILDQHIQEGCVVRTSKDVHMVSSARSVVLHVFRIRPGYDD